MQELKVNLVPAGEPDQPIGHSFIKRETDPNLAQPVQPAVVAGIGADVPRDDLRVKIGILVDRAIAARQRTRDDDRANAIFAPRPGQKRLIYGMSPVHAREC